MSSLFFCVNYIGLNSIAVKLEDNDSKYKSSCYANLSSKGFY